MQIMQNMCVQLAQIPSLFLLTVRDSEFIWTNTTVFGNQQNQPI